MADKQTKRGDYVAHGGEQHAMVLGLRKAVKEDKFQHKGWTLVDITLWGATARDEFIQAQLVSKVNELENAPTVPANAPPMWNPNPS